MRMSGQTRRWVVDTVIAGAVTAVEAAATCRGAWSHGHGHVQVGALWYVPVVIGGVSLIFRRRFPAAVLAVVLATTLWAEALGAWAAWLTLIVAFFTAVLERRRAAAIGSLVVGYGVSMWASRAHLTAAFALGLLAWLLILLAAAELIRTRRQRAAEITSRRQEEEKRRASEQRLAIARDLHDVVAHNISVINVQANTALHLMDRQPERAREALTAIHDVSKQALTELRSVLGVLRTDGGERAPLAPSPGLDRLRDLATGTAGLSVRLETAGDPRPLPAGVDLAAYRIVQEALTNTIRHSGGRTATVRLRYDEDAVTISIEDDGTAVHPPRRGNGMAGMTERAHALGGTLEAGPRPGGGFQVLARLPA
jgi:signal transduction histidine kinase